MLREKERAEAHKSVVAELIPEVWRHWQLLSRMLPVAYSTGDVVLSIKFASGLGELAS